MPVLQIEAPYVRVPGLSAVPVAQVLIQGHLELLLRVEILAAAIRNRNFQIWRQNLPEKVEVTFAPVGAGPVFQAFPAFGQALDPDQAGHVGQDVASEEIIVRDVFFKNGKLFKYLQLNFWIEFRTRNFDGVWIHDRCLVEKLMLAKLIEKKRVF